MRNAFAVAVLIALIALVVMSFAPASLVGVRAGLRSVAGAVTAFALFVLAAAGAWVWLRDRRHRHD